MTIIVTNHAVERFAERIIGTDVESLTAHERAMIRDAILNAVSTEETRRPRLKVYTQKATYLVVDRRVVTVLHPSQNTYSSSWSVVRSGTR
jgi:hypothetical protein